MPVFEIDTIRQVMIQPYYLPVGAVVYCATGKDVDVVVDGSAW